MTAPSLDTLPRAAALKGTLGERLRELVLQTQDDWVPAVERATLGGVVLAHGLQKVFGWFGGGGVGGTLDFFQDVLRLPAAVAVFVMVSDFVGALALILGLFTRIAALGTGAVMLGAVITVHASNGFFMNWFSNQPGEGFEFHLLALALVAALVVRGGGRASLDRLLWRRARAGAR